MSKIMVFPYLVYSPEQDTFIPCSVDVFATIETIKGDPHLRLAPGEGFEVEPSQINERGRYHRPPSKI